MKIKNNVADEIEEKRAKSSKEILRAQLRRELLAGGAHYKAIRSYVQTHAHGGETVTWGSDQLVMLTMRQLEEASLEIALAALMESHEKASLEKALAALMESHEK